MKSILTLGLVGALVGMAGCTPAERADVRQNVQGVRQQVRSATEEAKIKASNATAEAKIKTALESRKGMNAKGIDVEMNSGHVVLKGDVESKEQAELAERITLETEGVNTVDNQLMLRIPAKSEPKTVPGRQPYLGGP